MRDYGIYHHIGVPKAQRLILGFEMIIRSIFLESYKPPAHMIWPFVNLIYPEFLRMDI